MWKNMTFLDMGCKTCFKELLCGSPKIKENKCIWQQQKKFCVSSQNWRNCKILFSYKELWKWKIHSHQSKFFFINKIQSNIFQMTTLGITNFWPFLTGGRCSEGEAGTPKWWFAEGNIGCYSKVVVYLGLTEGNIQFINILRAFLPIFWHQKVTIPKCK